MAVVTVLRRNNPTVAKLILEAAEAAKTESTALKSPKCVKLPNVIPIRTFVKI